MDNHRPIAIGNYTHATNNHTIALGNYTGATLSVDMQGRIRAAELDQQYLNNIAIGKGASATYGGIAIGTNVTAEDGDIIITSTNPNARIILNGIDIREMYNMVQAMWDAPGMPGANAVLAELETDLAEDGT